MEKKPQKKALLIIATILVIAIIGALTVSLVKNDVKSTITLAIDQSDFDTQRSTTSLSGTVSSMNETMVSVSYKLDGCTDNLFCGEAELDGNKWNINKIFIKPGDNKIIITAKTETHSVGRSVNIYYDVGKPYELNEENIKYDDKSQTHYVNNIVITLFNTNVSEDRKQYIVEQVDGKVVGRTGADLYDIQVSEKTLNELEEICMKLEQFEEVFYAHVDYAMQLTTDTDVQDSSIAYKYWQEKGSWGINAIEVPSAWDYKERFSDIDVAVVDDGFDLEHEDLKDVFVPSVDWMKGVNDYKYYDENTKKETISSHGTHVAGIIGANSDNKGITGILDNVHIIYSDWRPNKTQQKQSWDTSSRILGSLMYSVEAGAKVINYSLGDDYSVNNKDFIETFKSNISNINRSQLWKDDQAEMSSKYMYFLLKEGYDFVVVQSAGNGVEVEVSSNAKETIAVDAENNGLWSSVTKDNVFGTTEKEKQDILDRIIIVGAAKRNEDGNYQQSEFSNGGKRVDICAPGEDIYSTTVKDSYGLMRGTSIAAPMVTGVCGMVWSINPGFTGAEVKKIVCNYTSITVADNPDENHPLVDTYKMVNAKLAVEEAIERTDKGVVKGNFVDITTKEPIKNVTIKCSEYLGDETVNIDEHKYRFENNKLSLRLPVGEYKFKVSADNYIDEEISIKSTAGKTNNLGNISLSKALSTVTGTVKDEKTEAPIANVTVKITGNQAESSEEVAKVRTDKNGDFSVELPYGVYLLYFEHDNYTLDNDTHSIRVTVSRENSTLVEEIMLTKKSVSSLKYEMREVNFEVKTSTGVLFLTNRISYPYFLGSSVAEGKINERYEKIINNYRETSSEDIESWYETVVEYDELYKLPFYYNMEITVSYNQNGYVSILEKTCDWSGGAHPYHYENGLTYRISDGKEMSYTDLIDGNEEQKKDLTMIYLREVNKNEIQIQENQIYDNWQAVTPFVLSDEGLSFYYNVGDAVDRVEIVIPYTNNVSPIIQAERLLKNPDNSNSDQLTNDIAKKVWEEAKKTYDRWVYLRARKENIYPNEKVTRYSDIMGEDIEYYRVKHDSVSTKNELRESLSKYFDSTICEEILYLYLEQNGKLYVQSDVNDDFDPEISILSTTVKKQDGNNAVISFDYYYKNVPKDKLKAEQEMKYVDNHWIFRLCQEKCVSFLRK